jgi:putative DNA primase/helicase
MRGNGQGRGHNSDHTEKHDHTLNPAHLRAEIARLRALKHEVDDIEYEFELAASEKKFGFGKRKFRKWVETPSAVPGSIDEINTLVDEVSDKPELIVPTDNLPAAANSVRDLLAAGAGFFEWGAPAKIITSGDGELPQIVPLTIEHVVYEVHERRRVIERKPGGKRIPATLRERVAEIYIIAKKGEWNLRRLGGVTTAPLLGEDGSIRVVEGYDPESRQYCANVPVLEVPERPTERQARDALRLLRLAFQTFPFADSEWYRDTELDLELVDVDRPPGLDESAFLAGLMTAVCRPSLYLAPGLMLVALSSGSGSGKGLLVRAISLIAYGARPVPFAPKKGEEQEKTITSALLEGRTMVFLDNVNDAVLSSPTLEQAQTERPFAVRLFHTQKFGVLDATPMIVAAGNGLSPSQDLVRRFAGMFVQLNARVENASLRRFPVADQAFLAEIEHRRRELLGAVLTIWRWGRQTREDLKVGLPFGSYSDWTRWCRDPLFTLGCRDPVERLEDLAAADPRRQNKLAIFTAWWERHGDTPVTAKDLHEEVKKLIDPEGGGVLQRLRPWLGHQDGVRLAGFEFRADKNPDPKRKREPRTYRLIDADRKRR